MKRSIKLWAVLFALVSLCLVFASCDSGSSDSDGPVPTYTVTFDMQGHGTQITAITDIPSGSTISAPTVPTANGYTFCGWYREGACTNEWNFSSDTVTADITLYAKWIPTAVSVTSVTLDKVELEITVGDPDVQLTATVAPDDATDKSVIWSSNNETVATVDQEGNVHAVASGTATITVKTVDGEKTATCEVTVALPEGALAGKFTVAEGKKVHFSKGNLVTEINDSGAPTAWKFAANQYDYLREGGANTTIGNAAGDVDLFGWSTSATKYGISTSTSVADYSGDFKDWGTAIDSKGTWRTLSKDEWTYLFNNHSKKWVTVNGVKGYVIAPDGFEGTLKDSYANDAELATAGNLVFLPAAGYRNGSSVNDVGSGGYYWSATADGSNGADGLYFGSSNAYVDCGDRYYGCSVRLVVDED